MNNLNWHDIKLVLSDKSNLGLKLLFIFMMLYIISTGGDHLMIKLFLICIGLFLSAFFIKKINQPLLWYLFLALLFNDLVCDYFVRANHHFLLIYLTILVIIYLHNNKLELFISNIKFLVVIVLLSSGIQKLVSEQFISGDFYYYMINTGKFFKPLLHFNQEMSSTISSNYSQIQELGQTNPNSFKTIRLKNIIPHVAIISRIFSWFTISIELISGILFLWKPKHTFTHILFILLILGIFLTRLENGFIVLLAISGVWLSDTTKIRAAYTILAIASLSFIVTKIGFY